MAESMNGAVRKAEDEVDLILVGSVLDSPVGKLSAKIVDKLPSGGESYVRSAFLTIIIALLPILADLIQQNCDPSPEKLSRAMRTRLPRKRLQFINQANGWCIENKGAAVFSDLGGDRFGEAVVDVIGEPENLELVRAAMTTPPPLRPPIWGTFSIN